MRFSFRPPHGSRVAGVAVLLVCALAGAAGYLLLTRESEPPPVATPESPPVALEEPEPEPEPERRPTVKPLLPSGAGASFRRMAASSGGSVGVAVAPLGRGSIRVLGDLPSGHAWSVMKVPVLVTLIADRGGVDGLSAQEQEWARAALTESDNDAAKAMFAELESEHGGLEGASDALEQTLRAAGDQTTEINTAPNSGGFTTFGQTDWSAEESARFFRALAAGCLLDDAGSEYVVGLMGDVVGGQRWGMGQVGLDGADVAFKAGWGPEDGGPYLVRQSAIVGSGRRGYVVSIVAQGGGSFESGIAVVNAAAEWVADNIDPRLRRPALQCE